MDISHTYIEVNYNIKVLHLENLENLKVCFPLVIMLKNIHLIKFLKYESSKQMFMVILVMYAR